jgi:hypothetical protein
MTPTKTTSPAITATPSKLPRQQTTVFCPITGYPAIRAKVTFRIYAKITVALARGACRHAPMKIHESPRHLSPSRANPNGPAIARLLIS